MAIVNGLIGGGVNQIAAGSSQIFVQVYAGSSELTISGLTFSISDGSTTYNVTTDSSGRVDKIVDAGSTWTITPPTLSSTYVAMPTQSIDAQSTQGYLVPFVLISSNYVSASNITVSTWVANTDNTTAYDKGFVYMADVAVTGMLATMYPKIEVDDATYISGNVWDRYNSLAGAIRIYSKTNTTITVLTAIGMVIT